MAYEYVRETPLFEDSCFLCKPITEIDENGVVKITEWDKREVFCKVGSLVEKEFFKALQSGIQGAFKLEVNIGDWEAYLDGTIGGQELTVEFRGKRFEIYRVFRKADTAELYCQFKAGSRTGPLVGF